jgi:hypothetical protein
VLIASCPFVKIIVFSLWPPWRFFFLKKWVNVLHWRTKNKYSPHCLDNRLTDDSKVHSPMHQPCSTPQTHFFFCFWYMAWLLDYVKKHIMNNKNLLQPSVGCYSHSNWIELKTALSTEIYSLNILFCSLTLALSFFSSRVKVLTRSRWSSSCNVSLWMSCVLDCWTLMAGDETSRWSFNECSRSSCWYCYENNTIPIIFK